MNIIMCLFFQIDDEAEEEAKSMDLNKVVLRFQAFHYDKNIENYRPITLPVDSEVVFNLSELMCKGKPGTVPTV